MKKSAIAICAAAIAAVAFAQEPSFDGAPSPDQPAPKAEGRIKAPRGGFARERPTELFVTDKTDDATIEAYKKSVLAQIDESVAKYREQKPSEVACKCENCGCEDGCKCGAEPVRRPPLRLAFSAGARSAMFPRGEFTGRAGEGRRHEGMRGRGQDGRRPGGMRGPKGMRGKGPRPGAPAPDAAPAPEASDSMPQPAPEAE